MAELSDRGPPKLGDIKSGFELGRKTNDNRIWAECVVCGKLRWTFLYKDNHYCSRCHSCAVGTPEIRIIRSKFFSGDNHPNWRDIGSKKIFGGYVWIKISPDNPYFPMSFHGQIAEHRLVMAEHIGRCLQKGEHVHHKNGIKSDNRLENLELVSRSIHLLTHSKGYQDGYNQGYTDAIKQISELAKNQRLVSWQVSELTKLVTEIKIKLEVI